jgi:hypothetical protein
MKHAVLRPASRRWRLGVPGAVLAVLALGLTGLAAPAAASAIGHATSSALTALSPGFNRPGNNLIADQFNNRVIEVDPATQTLTLRQETDPSSMLPSDDVTSDQDRPGPFRTERGESGRGLASWSVRHNDFQWPVERAPCLR